MRRRKQADKGVAPEAGAGGNFLSGGTGESAKGGANGGWNEVAKKVPASANGGKEDSLFKVVSGKKKSKR